MTGHRYIVWPDGSKYDGDFQGGHMHGTGQYTWPNGDTYNGEWQEGKRQGRGVYVFDEGSKKYSGSFNNDTIEGFGR